MSKNRLFSRGVALPLAATFVALAAMTAVGAGPGDEAARLDGFSHPNGTNYFALSLKAPAAPASGPREVVLLVSTAATQVGDYRTKSLEAAQAALANLGPRDKVKLVAFDTTAVPLTKGFVAPNSPEMARAMQQLNARTPLSTNDLEEALKAAAGSYQGAAKGGRAIVLVSDGSSRGNVLSTEQFEKMVSGLVAERIPVISYGVGPRIDGQMLNALAGRTGGAVVYESKDVPASQAGRQLAAAADAPVYWPAQQPKLPDGVEIYPKTMPPLRADRDTVLVGATKNPVPNKLDLAVEGAGGKQNLAFALPALKSNKGNGYLASVVDQAKLDGGVSLPIFDTATLSQARDAINTGGQNLNQIARQSLAMGNFDAARQTIDEALRRDPADREALAVKAALDNAIKTGADQKGAAALRPPAAGGTPVIPVQSGAGANDLNIVGGVVGAPTLPPPVAGEGAMALAEDQMNKAAQEQKRKEVQNLVNDSRRQMSTNPEGALQALQLKAEEIAKLPSLPPEFRENLIGMLKRAEREANRRKTELDLRRIQMAERDASARERMLVNENLDRNQQKLKQLMDRFDSLMAEGRYKLAEEAVGPQAVAMAPNDPVPVAAVTSARMTGSLTDMLALRVARQKGVVDMLYGVEKSHVPTPDDPPIVYPDAEVWKELTDRRKEKYSSQDLTKRPPGEKKILEELKKPTDLDFTATRFKDIVTWLKDRHNIEIQLDEKALSEASFDMDKEVDINLKGISLKSALKLLLKPYDLTYLIKNEVLMITTKEQTSLPENMPIRVYPVADLVVPINTPAMSGLGGFGGSMGGMGGMMGGGMGGMGMGGMGGGMGGMGGGMGGMGMFNVPRERVPNERVDRLRAFFVKEEAVPANSKAQSLKPQTTKAKPSHVTLDIEEGADPVAAWDKYFAANEPDPAAVREAVRNLREGAVTKDGKDVRRFEHIIALIQAALRHGQVQPWMYDALAVAMQAAERPRAEIERAVMSAADFATGSADLMHLGAYLDRLGYPHRALKIFKQVAQMEPMWPEPFVAGMRVAQRLHDVEGIQWSTAGILSQAWPPNQEEVWKTALRVSKATLDDLRANKRTAEAKRFEAALDEAVARDCAVAVYWTGDADVELFVKEPTGTICSLQNWRTTAGGMMQGDRARADGGETAQGHYAVYVCPKGFNGTYELLVRRVWGDLTTGKVTVEAITHFRTPKAVRKWQTVALEDGEALLKFDLADGRRKEPLREQQLANAVAAQVALTRQQQILAQQVAALDDPRAQARLAQARQAAAAVPAGGAPGGQQPGGNGFFPFPVPYRGAVGYQPVIVTLPEGANFAATAVVSADRRYVRITCLPFFSGIAKVTTFNSDSGRTGGGGAGGGQAGTGGQGYSALFGSNQGGQGQGVNGVNNNNGGLGGGGLGGGGLGGGGLGGGGLGGGGLGGGLGGGGLGGGLF